MIPYARGLLSSNNYGMVKTETVFGFVPPNHDSFVNNSFRSTEPMEWIFTHGDFESPFSDTKIAPRSLKIVPKVVHNKPSTSSSKDSKKSPVKTSKKVHTKKPERQSKGVKKCIFKILNKKNKRKGGRKKFKGKKYMMPIILGLLAAKSLLIPIILKFLAFISAKGLAMGFFSTVLASVLSLKNVFDHNHNQRRDDSKTQVEIVQVPGRNDDHHYYRNDDHIDHYYDDYKRGDYAHVVKWPVKYDLGVLRPQNNRIS